MADVGLRLLIPGASYGVRTDPLQGAVAAALDRYAAERDVPVVRTMARRVPGTGGVRLESTAGRGPGTTVRTSCPLRRFPDAVNVSNPLADREGRAPRWDHDAVADVAARHVPVAREAAVARGSVADQRRRLAAQRLDQGSAIDDLDDRLLVAMCLAAPDDPTAVGEAVRRVWERGGEKDGPAYAALAFVAMHAPGRPKDGDRYAPLPPMSKTLRSSAVGTARFEGILVDGGAETVPGEGVPRLRARATVFGREVVGPTVPDEGRRSRRDARRALDAALALSETRDREHGWNEISRERGPDGMPLSDAPGILDTLAVAFDLPPPEVVVRAEEDGFVAVVRFGDEEGAGRGPAPAPATMRAAAEVVRSLDMTWHRLAVMSPPPVDGIMTTRDGKAWTATGPDGDTVTAGRKATAVRALRVRSSVKDGVWAPPATLRIDGTTGPSTR